MTGGKRGRGSENKTPFIAAVSTNEKGHPVYMNFNVVKGFRFTAVTEAKCEHFSRVTGGPESVTKE